MPSVIIVGGGPAGLGAAEVLAGAGWRVTLTEALGSPGRKFLRAGVGGLNLTHSQNLEAFLAAYGPDRPRLEGALRAFGPAQITAWAEGLGIRLFTGTSGRIFPEGMGAAPLLEAWLGRLQTLGADLRCLWRWTGFEGSPGTRLTFDTPGGPQVLAADRVLLALGGPTWPALGTGGSWKPLLEAAGVAFEPWAPANCGWEVAWTPFFAGKFAGQPLKDLIVTAGPSSRRGELMVTPWGLEGGPLYALGRTLRSQAGPQGSAVTLDLVPGRTLDRVRSDLGRPREGRSLATHLQKTLGITGAKVGLLREVLKPGSPDPADRVAGLLKALPLALTAPRPLAEAISAAGGVAWDELTPDLELKRIPGVFCAGEMVAWEAPTGGYLLTACWAQGRQAAGSLAAGR